MEGGVAKDCCNDETYRVLVPVLFTDTCTTRERVLAPNLVDEVDRLFADTSVSVLRPQGYRPQEPRQLLHHIFLAKGLLEENGGSLHTDEIDLNIVLLEALLEDL